MHLETRGNAPTQGELIAMSNEVDRASGDTFFIRSPRDLASILAIEEPINAITESYLIIESPAFKEGNNWRFADGDISFTAEMLDKRFLQEVNEGLGKGDVLVVKPDDRKSSVATVAIYGELLNNARRASPVSVGKLHLSITNYRHKDVSLSLSKHLIPLAHHGKISAPALARDPTRGIRLPRFGRKTHTKADVNHKLVPRGAN